MHQGRKTASGTQTPYKTDIHPQQTVQTYVRPPIQDRIAEKAMNPLVHRAPAPAPSGESTLESKGDATIPQ